MIPHIDMTDDYFPQELSFSSHRGSSENMSRFYSYDTLHAIPSSDKSLLELHVKNHFTRARGGMGESLA